MRGKVQILVSMVNPNVKRTLRYIATSNMSKLRVRARFVVNKAKKVQKIARIYNQRKKSLNI